VTDQAGAWKDFINEEDWEYDCRVGCVNGALHYVPTTLSVQRQHGAPRLSNNGSTDPRKLSARSKAHQEILNHALDYGVKDDSEEFITLIKSTFLLSRQCAAAGVLDESENLFMCALPFLLKYPQTKTKAHIYLLGTKIVGYRCMGLVTCYIDRVRT
jgi:hypothetical protein